jgi:hypothetical protein
MPYERTDHESARVRRMHAMRKLPVVPIRRMHSRLPCRANHNDALAHPASTRGAFRPIVTKREVGCDGRGCAAHVFRADERR